MSNTNKPPEKLYRYPGVTPFSTDQAQLFFGRQQECADLYRLMRREQLVVLLGKSGYGKSSLINAGIIPLCQKEQEFSPIVIRFGAWTEHMPLSPLEKAKSCISENYSALTFLERLLPGDNSLWHRSKARQLNGGGRPMLIFDQFEELFSYPEEAVNAFKVELVELLNTGIPLRFRRKAEAFENISEEEEEQLEAQPEAHIVFVIRSDRLHLLDRLKDYLPEILRHSFEIKALLPKDARDAIQLPARAEGNFVTPSFEFSEAALVKLEDYLKDPLDGRIEGLLIQMLCEFYERQIVYKQGIRILDIAEIGDPEQAVATYYEEKIKDLPPPLQLHARKLIEEGLISENEGLRLSLHENSILHEFGVDKNLLNMLIDNRLLRSEPFLRGGYTYELSHDRLVTPVLQARNLRRKEEQRKAEEWKDIERQLQLDAVRRKALEEHKLRKRAERNEKRVKYFLGGVALLLLIAIGLATRVYQLNKEAVSSLEAVYDSEITRYGQEINLAERTIIDLEHYDAEEDVIQVESLKIKGFRRVIDSLQRKKENLKK